VYLRVRVCLSAIISSELHVRSSQKILCMLPMAVARSSSDSVVICYVLPVLWMTLICSKAKVARRRHPAEAQCTRSLGLAYKLCAVIPVACQWTHGTTFSALKVTSQMATQGQSLRSMTALLVIGFTFSHGDANFNVRICWCHTNSH